METVMYRQGDVLIRSIDKKPEEGLEEVEADNGRVILAYGEVTGHAHALPQAEAALFAAQYDEDKHFLTINEGGSKLTHEEHATIELPAGDYEVIRQREFSPTEQSRAVVD